ncbi:MAG: hypothetical protein EOO41_00040 [Methanobacteriota archaeon]|nr:MAG: hypothetical protein EOO41_00040 [Euryarchaeota archaeon]
MARITSRSLDGVGLTRERLADITLSSALLALITVTASSRRACPAQSQRMCVWLRRAAMLAAGVSASAATVWWLRKRSASLMDECVPLDANALEEAASQAGDDADPRDCAADSLVDQLLAKHTISSRVDAALGALDSERRAPSGSGVAIDAVNCATNVMALPNPHKLADVLAHLSSAASPHLARLGLNAPSAARASQRSLPRTAAAALTAARRESVVRHLQYDEAPAPAFGTGPHAGTGRPESSNPLSLLSTLLARARRLAASPAAQQFVQWVTHIWRAVQTWQAAHPGASSASVSVITLLIILWAARRAPTSRSR